MRAATLGSIIQLLDLLKIFLSMLTKFTYWFGMLLALSLTACGGGGQGPYVTEIQANQLVYGKLSTFTITGDSLNKGVSVSALGCSSLEQDANYSNTSQNWTCFIDSVGPKAIRLTAMTATGVV